MLTKFTSYMDGSEALPSLGYLQQIPYNILYFIPYFKIYSADNVIIYSYVSHVTSCLLETVLGGTTAD